MVRESVSVFKSILKYHMTLPVLEPSQKQNSTPLKLCIIHWLFTSCSCVLLLYWYFMGFILGLCTTHVNQNVFWSISKSQSLMFSFPPLPLDLLGFISNPVPLYNLTWDPFKGINCISHLFFNVPFIFLFIYIYFFPYVLRNLLYKNQPIFYLFVVK